MINGQFRCSSVRGLASVIELSVVEAHVPRAALRRRRRRRSLARPETLLSR